MAARTSIIDESADDGVPADFWNEVLDSFDVIDDDPDSEEAKKAAEERARKKKEEDLEKVKKFNEAWNITPAAETQEIRIVEKAPEPTPEPVPKIEPRCKSPECTIIPEETEVVTVEDDVYPMPEHSVLVIPAEGMPKDPRLKRLEQNNRIQSPSSPTEEARHTTSDRELAPSQRYFEREREDQIRREREDFERARSRLRSRSPGIYSRFSPSDEENDIHRPISHKYGRGQSAYRSRSRERSMRRSRSPHRGRSSRRSTSRSRGTRSRRSSRSRSRSRSRTRRTDESSGSTAMMTQMTAMMQMMTDPKMMIQMNPMMAMMMQMNPMMAAAAAATQKATETVKETNTVEQQDKKDDITAQVNIIIYMSMHYD